MDEQECIFEIVDGVLTIVPKDQSSSSSIEEEQNSNKKIDGSKGPKQRSSSIASSTSTPSLSEQERDELCSSPFTHIYAKPPSPSLPIEQSADILDIFSTPITSINPNSKTLLDDSLSSVSSYGERLTESKKVASSIPRSSSPIHQERKSSSSIKGRRRTQNHFTSICEQITYTLFGPLHV